jgi:hypothetical protein
MSLIRLRIRSPTLLNVSASASSGAMPLEQPGRAAFYAGSGAGFRSEINGVLVAVATSTPDPSVCHLHLSCFAVR